MGPRITGIVVRAAGHILRFETHPCWLGACSPTERVLPFPWRLPWVIRNASSNSCARISAWPVDSARVSPLSHAAREGHLHIVRLLLEHGANPNLPEDLAPDGRALFEACCANHLEVAELLLEHGANPNAGLDSSGCCLTIGEVYHGDRAKPLQQLLRRHGAYSPPYSMSALDRKSVV